ncbi:hypothetical protein B0H14DRAFT_963450 [Mycena olivaceomarginata]|nr:hypothetical protein B0H14DRAFT_963450 [Mycena olivaceomarginata]
MKLQARTRLVPRLFSLFGAVRFTSRTRRSSIPSLFRSLPSELRLQIYDAVVDLPLDCRVARRTFELKRPKRLAAPTDRLPIPWLSLMLVCKIIANELRHHIYSVAGNTTYHLEVDNLQNQYAISHRVTWRRIPCPPSCVRTLHADLVFDLNTMFWASDGPMPVLTELYQVLNCFIHKGPLLPRRSPLDRHIHLGTLILQVRVIDKRRMPNDVDESKKKQFRRDLEEESISLLVDQGVLFGAVDKIVSRR